MHVEPAVFAAQPSYAAAIVVADGVPNGPSDAAGDALLRAAEEALQARGLERAADDPHVAAWRAAFSAFGAKPSKFNCSAEALAGARAQGRRAAAHQPPRRRLQRDQRAPHGAGRRRGRRPPRGLAAPGDRRRARRPSTARTARPSRARSSGATTPAVTCRRWNWRQGRRTALTEETSRALFIFDRARAAAPRDARGRGRRADRAADRGLAGREDHRSRAVARLSVELHNHRLCNSTLAGRMAPGRRSRG